MHNGEFNYLTEGIIFFVTYPMYEFRVASHLLFKESMPYSICHVPLELLKRWSHTSVTIAYMELPTAVLRTLIECRLDDVTWTST